MRSTSVRRHLRRLRSGGRASVAMHVRRLGTRNRTDVFGRATDTRPVWQQTAAGYQSSIGVHQPWIAEISPMQYAGLSKRGRAQYDAKREREWAASAEAKDQYRRLVLDAFNRGEFTKDTPGVSEDARRAVLHAQMAAEKAAQEAARAAAHAANRDVDVERLQVGDRVYDIMGGHYARVVKKNKKTVRLRAEATEGYMAGREWNADPRRLQFKAYSEV